MTASTASIVFITGSFMGNNCWDEWIAYFEDNSYSCIAPAWPYKCGSPEELRNRHPDAGIASNRLAGLIDYFTSIINSIPGKPIVIGHSLGGLIVQLLLQKNLVRAGVAIHSFPPSDFGAFKFSFLKAVWEAMAFFSPEQKSYLISFKKWKYAIANGMSCEQQKGSYYQYAIPESKMLIRDAFKYVAKINFNKPHAPLLFIAGSDDRIAPPALNYNNYRQYKQDGSVTSYKEFQSRNHLAFCQQKSNEEADFILDWLKELR